MSKSVSFFETKITKHSLTYPELLHTEWLTCTEQKTLLRHLTPCTCPKWSVNKTLLKNDYITALDILKNNNLCSHCKNYSLSIQGSLGSMLESQIKILEETDTELIIDKFWQGTNRTINAETHKKFWNNNLEKNLKKEHIKR